MTSMKILIVEDDKEIARVVRDGLSSDSHTVEIAEDGNEGGFLARNYEYDLIILDNSLPKKSGLTLCKEIRTGGKPVPIIFLSVNNDTDTKVAALESGADDYMTKPFSMAELRARIKAVARRPKNMAEQLSQRILARTKVQSLDLLLQNYPVRFLRLLGMIELHLLHILISIMQVPCWRSSLSLQRTM